MISGPFRLLAPFALLLLAPHVHAAWTLVQADVPVTAIHETGRYQAEAGQIFALDDIVETPANGGVQIQDGAGNSVALGHYTRVLLTRDAHIALLSGWVKVLRACDANTANCTVPVIQTTRTTITPANNTALVIAAAAANDEGADPQDADADAVFCESGAASLLGVNGLRGKASPVQLDMHRFATHLATSDTISVTARPDPAFVTAMPVMFRDALLALPMPANLRKDPPGNIRPVAYSDVSDWLRSGLTARRAPSTRFTARFRVRLSDPEFHRAIVQHIRDLPDWLPLVFPPPQHAVIRSRAIQTRSAYSYSNGPDRP
jgi:hypothetical protein